MSTTETETGAKAIQARAAEWLAEQHYADEWTPENQAALNAWLAQDLAHEVAYWRLDAAWDRTGRLAALRGPLHRAPSAPRKGRSALPRLVAAVAVAAVIGGAALFETAPAHDQAYTTPIGGQKTLALSDGSRITLNTDTTLRVQMRAGSRKVWLDHGEAFFDIRHDAAHPFVVMAAGHRITDLGTKFSVRSSVDGLGLKVALIEGRAELDASGSWVSSHRAVLAPGDIAIANARTLAVSHLPAKQMAAEFGWRQGMLVFQHTTLEEAVAEFNRYNAQKLAIADPDIAQMRIAGTFQARNTELFTEAVQDLFKLRVSKSGSQTIISR
ncbi:MAG TPA: FecR domain-containing protein [Rhizomicrobium sp.]|jgi:transmembrane sensor